MAGGKANHGHRQLAQQLEPRRVQATNDRDEEKKKVRKRAWALQRMSRHP